MPKKKKIEKYKGYHKKITYKILDKCTPIIIKQFKYITVGKSLEEAQKEINKKVKYTKQQKYWMRLASFVLEVYISFERQKFYPVFLKSYSRNYEKQGFSRVKQFIYHIENYLSEVYILYERLNSLFCVLNNEGKRVGLIKKNWELLNKLEILFKKNMKEILRVRGIHIHKKRFRDKELSYLGIIELKLEDKLPKKEKIKYEYSRKLGLMMARIEWREQIKKDNQKLEETLNFIFYHLNKSKIMTNIAKKQ